MTAALELTGVSKSYAEVEAVQSFDLTVEAGSIFGLLGPNGAGKTTLIRMIMDIIRPDRGTIHLLGSTDPELRRDRIGYLPEERGIYRKMKVRELLVYLAQLRSIPAGRAREQADFWIERFSLSERADEKIEALSKGNAQKVQFIATILHEPEAIILDEPFSGFDPVNVDLVKNVMLELKDKGMTILLSTHQMETVERLCDSICLIHEGKKILDGSIREVKQQRGTNAVQIEFDGSTDFYRDPKWVSRFDESSRYVEMIPAAGVDPSELLRLAIADVQVSRFQIMEPSVHQIFLEAVGVTESSEIRSAGVSR